ncbi:MAG: DUF58 domain-containing protein [Lachnospiraceae bacterium]|nr:DUF58 domain-containing protein [Lachnospiraceae bacterium]
MSEVFNSEFYSKLSTLRMRIALSIASGMSGSRKSKAKGNSVEFSDFREYRLGDDIRRIDWNAYGRFDKLFIKLFMEEKEGIFNVFLDASKSMDYGEANKGVCAKRLAGAISYLVLENGDRLFLNFLEGERIISYKSLTGLSSFGKVTDYLENLKFESAGDVYESLKHKEFRERGMSFLISDGFTDNLEDEIKFLKFHRQEVVFVHVLAREEVEPDFEGTFALVDSETRGDLRLTMSNSMVKTYRKSYEEFINRCEAVCKKYSVIYIPVISDAGMESLIFGSLSKIATKS